jgi:hypothetical protein
MQDPPKNSTIFELGKKKLFERKENAEEAYNKADKKFEISKKVADRAGASKLDIRRRERDFSLKMGRYDILAECLALFSDKTVLYTLGLWQYYQYNFFKKYKVKKDEIEGAFAFFFLHFFMFSGKNVTISGVTKERVDEFIKFVEDGEFEYLIHLYRCRNLRKETEILHEDAIELLSNPIINNTDTLCYLDPPYYGTADPYSDRENKGRKSKTDDDKDKPKEFDMKGLMKAITFYKGNFIFSCRAAAIASNKEDEGKERFLIAELFDWFRYVVEEQKKPLYVIFNLKLKTVEDAEQNEKRKLSLKETIEKAISRNDVFEIMIMNFKVQNTLHDNILYVGGDGSEVTEQKTFYVMEFEKFKAVATARLLLDNDYSQLDDSKRRPFAKLFPSPESDEKL